MRSKNTMERKLFSAIMSYWFECVSIDADCDMRVNDLLENFVESQKVTYDPGDLDRTVLNLTNSQKRKLLKEMLSSGIAKPDRRERS